MFPIFFVLKEIALFPGHIGISSYCESIGLLVAIVILLGSLICPGKQLIPNCLANRSISDTWKKHLGADPPTLHVFVCFQFECLLCFCFVLIYLFSCFVLFCAFFFLVTSLLLLNSCQNLKRTKINYTQLVVQCTGTEGQNERRIKEKKEGTNNEKKKGREKVW